MFIFLPRFVISVKCERDCAHVWQGNDAGYLCCCCCQAPTLSLLSATEELALGRCSVIAAPQGIRTGSSNTSAVGLVPVGRRAISPHLLAFF